MTTITYHKKIVMEVNNADNMLMVYLNPDPYKASTQIYGSNNFGNPQLDDHIDITPNASQLGTICTLCAIGSNFEGGGAFKIKFLVDGSTSPVYTINENLAVWTSKQWTAQLKHV
jgi:hypothetical protein